jgi:hypothetical protein
LGVVGSGSSPDLEHNTSTVVRVVGKIVEEGSRVREKVRNLGDTGRDLCGN